MTALLSLNQLRSIQKLGEKGMTSTAYIYRKEAQAKDSGDPYGDDIVVFETTPDVVSCWLVTQPTQQLDQDEGQVRAISTHHIRVPVGTNIGTGDKVIVGGDSFVVTDATVEQTWPEWTVAYLRGYELGST